MKVGFIGVGKLGQACAEVIACNHDVLGFDLQDRFPSNFSMVSSVGFLGDRDIIFIAVDTPHDPDYDGRTPSSHLPPKDFSYGRLEEALRSIRDLEISEDTTVVIISTVLPGTLRSRLSEIFPGKNLIYNPYLIAMGTVKWDMVNPEMIMIGSATGEACKHVQRLAEFYKDICANNPEIHVGTWEEIESMKVFYNTFISAKIGLVNMIQDVAERIGNMDSGFVASALAKCDRRIMGPAYMVPGMGDGGGCHPRDNIALRHLAKNLRLGYDLFDAVMGSREQQALNLARFLASFNMAVVIVGKAYKPMVEYENGSYSVLVGHYLEELGVAVEYLDENTGDIPAIMDCPRVFLLAHDMETTYGAQLDHVRAFYRAGEHSFEDSYAGVSKTTEWKKMLTKGSVVVDPWRKVPDIEGCKVIHYGNTRDRKRDVQTRVKTHHIAASF